MLKELLVEQLNMPLHYADKLYDQLTLQDLILRLEHHSLCTMLPFVFKDPTSSRLLNCDINFEVLEVSQSNKEEAYVKALLEMLRSLIGKVLPVDKGGSCTIELDTRLRIEEEPFTYLIFHLLMMNKIN